MLINPDASINDADVFDMRQIAWSRSSGSAASDGAYMKADTILDGVKTYLKLSNYDIARGIFGHESINEIIAERLGRLLEFSVPEGRLRKCRVIVEGREYTAYIYMSKTFKQPNMTRISFEEFYRERAWVGETPLSMCQRYDWSTDIFKMFVFDYLIFNRDRHGANLEVFQDSSGFLKLSPLFDNGLSFICTHTDPDTVEKFDVMLDRPVNNFIGERSLDKNLLTIDRKIHFGKLVPEHRSILFEGLDNSLPSVYFEKIWEIITRRWERVKEFRST